MNERIISIESYSPLEIYGPNDRYLNLIKDRFPKLKIIARGDVIKIIGEKSQIDLFDRLFGLLLVHYDEFGKITENDLFEIFGNDQEEDENNQVRPIEGNDILVYGNHGLQVRARTVNQRMLVESSQKNDMVFAIGRQATGKP
jgi:phosphate starvation-inducible PhoH-like protein